MSSSRTIFIAVLGAILLVGCDFEPAHKQGAESEKVSSIAVLSHKTTIAVRGEREGFILEHMLRENLGSTAADPLYTLTVDLNVSTREGPLVGRDVNRYIRVGTASIILEESGTGRLMLTDSISATATWDQTRWAAVNQASFDDATARVLTILADRIHHLLLAQATQIGV
ncbi:MAG: hypothetical protein OXC91_08415 [Rhodobacteraceae bacterium]|nr:hypothetical protein [Paracoccaceae bacterium]